MKDSQKIQEDFVKSFNEQFAVNQNNHQSAFIQLLSIILSVIVGFGYSFVKFETELKILDFTAILVISEGILTLGLALVVSYAYGYRRDQIVVNEIRKRANIFEMYSDEKWNIFPKSFDFQAKIPNLSKRWKRFNWMPEFHKIFSISFVLLQISIIIAYFSKCCNANTFLKIKQIDIASLIVFLLTFVFIYLTYYILTKNYKKIIKLEKEEIKP